MLLQQIISQSNNEKLVIYNSPVLMVTGGIDTLVPTLLWFNAYKASDFPEVICNKKYFFMYGTDHSTGDGAIGWGEGNELNGADFEELGIIIEGYQSETPFLFRVNDDLLGEKIYFYFHTMKSEPGNSNLQQTRLLTTTGGLLHTAVWNDRGRPLGLVSGENHTGYCKVYNHPTDLFRAVHLSKGGMSAEYKFSISASADDLTTRDGIIDLQTHMPSGWEMKPSYGVFFKLYSKHWWIGTLEPYDSNVYYIDKKCIVCETDSDFNVTRYISELHSELAGSYSVFIDGTDAHLYYEKTLSEIYHIAFDLTFLQTV